MFPQGPGKVDFGAVGREAADQPVALVLGDLKRLTTGGEYDEDLIVAFYGRREGNRAAIRREGDLLMFQYYWNKSRSPVP